MDIFEYLPQLVIAYDGNDKYANLIHVKKANKNSGYFCPCCGGVVKPRALASTKEQPHYYHITGKCTKESQLHFFCKNWLFEPGSKFYINEELFEVLDIDIEKQWDTPFGNYRPDITVYTSSGKTIYFEMFFSNRKPGDDYFCKWNNLGNDVVEVNIKEYMSKSDASIIPKFTYLFHDGKCFSKPYVKRDLYANTIAKVKKALSRQTILDYKSRIEQLDWFWAQIQRNESKESILNSVSCMGYEDMVTCYNIIKRKHCVSYLKNDVLNLINETVVKGIRKKLDLPFNENVYFDLKNKHGRTYEIGIRLNVKLTHIIYNDFYKHCEYPGYCFDKINGYPKVVFKKNIFTPNEVKIPKNKIGELKALFEATVQYKEELAVYDGELYNVEKNGYKIKVKNNRYTVLLDNHSKCSELLLDNYPLDTIDINVLVKTIDEQMAERKCKQFLKKAIHDDYYCGMAKQLEYSYRRIKCKIETAYKGGKYCQTGKGIYVSLWIFGHEAFSKKIGPFDSELKKAVDECKEALLSFTNKYANVLDIISAINKCKNKLWNAEFIIDYMGTYKLILYLAEIGKEGQRYIEDINLHELDLCNRQSMIQTIEKEMERMLKRLEANGYRIIFEGGI